MTDAEQKRPVVLGRKDLYQRVWETPISRLAIEYGISDRGLAKICGRLKIPCPPRGYWAMKAAGKKVVQIQLPEAGPDTPLEVRLAPAPPSTKLAEVHSEINDKLIQLRKDTAQIVVPERLVRPHPIIAGWLADHEQKKREARQERDPYRRGIFQPAAFADLDRRKHRILDTLFKALEPRGFTIKAEQYRGVYFEVQKERIDYVFREKQKQFRRPLTDEEKRWSYDHNKPWRQELKPTGILVFSIKTYLGNGLPHEWVETPDKPIEALVPDIVAALLLAGEVLTKRRQERIEAEKRRLEEERKRYIERQRQQQDLNRWEKFLALAQQWKDAESARQFLVVLENTPQSEDTTYGDRSPAEWLGWAREWLETFDPLIRGPKQIYSELANTDSGTDRGHYE